MKRKKKRPANEKAGPPTGKPGFMPSSWRHDWLLGFFLVAVTMIAFQPVWHAGFIWDDDLYVTANPLLTAPEGLRRIWFSLDSPSQYFPLTYTSFYMERGLWGLNPTGYHLVNLLLHSANALLVWRVLAGLRVPGAWLAAAIFALHPVQVESVAWITERKNVLMGFFFLLTLLAWLNFIDKQCKRPWRFYVLALAFYALSLSAKTTACTLPAALLLILWLKKLSINWRRLAQVAPFVAIGIGMGLVTIWWERYHIGTQGKLFAIGPMERVLIASRAVWFYAGKLLWPVNLTFSYPRWTISASDPRAYGWLLATAALGVVIWRTRRWTGRSVEVAVMFFVVTLSPVLGFIMLYTFVYSFVADHYQYLACIGPIALVAAGMKRKSFLQPVLAAALLITLGTLTWRQCGIYANEGTLWLTTIARNPNAWLAHNNLGNTFLEKGQLDEAIAHYQKALQLKPDYANAYYNLGNALLRKGQLDEAITQYQEALQLNPDNAQARVNFGTALSQEGKLDEAITQFQQAAQIEPNNEETHNNLGAALLQKGAVDEAVAQFQQAAQIEPNNEETHNNLGAALLQKGRVAEAIAQFRQALQIAPANPKALNNLAWFLATWPEASWRDGNKAVELARQANVLAGGNDPVFLHTLAAAYAEAGRFGDAVQTAQKAIALAQAAGQQDEAGQFNDELQRYKSGLPLHREVNEK